MGLAEPKSRKQAYQLDPRNTRWANGTHLLLYKYLMKCLGVDTSKFGYRMLEKMGWNGTTGLGLNQDGMTEHVKITHKQDQFGIGMDTKTGEKWIEHQDAFDSLLASLNSQAQSVECPLVQSVDVELGLERREQMGRLAHRSKYLKAKMRATSSEETLNQIFGVRKKDFGEIVSPVTTTDYFTKRIDGTISTSETQEPKKAKKKKHKHSKDDVRHKKKSKNDETKAKKRKRKE
jgi:Pin2-interacting protein X1